MYLCCCVGDFVSALVFVSVSSFVVMMLREFDLYLMFVFVPAFIFVSALVPESGAAFCDFCVCFCLFAFVPGST